MARYDGKISIAENAQITGILFNIIALLKVIMISAIGIKLK
jgi:hypothetical protein